MRCSRPDSPHLKPRRHPPARNLPACSLPVWCTRASAWAGRRGQWLLALLAVLLVLAAPPARAEKPPTLEYQVKASYLYNFLRFVEWPPDAFAAGTMLICVFGEDNFGTALRTIADETVRGLAVAVRRFSEPEGLEACHVVYVSASMRDREPQVLQHLAGRPVLTIGETAGFTKRGGAINLIRVADKIRFEINQQVAERNRLKISAQLLQLGVRQ